MNELRPGGPEHSQSTRAALPDAVAAGRAERERRYRAMGWWPGERLCERYAALAQRLESRLAVADASGRRLSHGGLWREGGRLAEKLKAGGIGPGDIVILLLPNIVEGQVAFVALLRLGAVPASLPTRTDPGNGRPRGPADGGPGAGLAGTPRDRAAGRHRPGSRLHLRARTGRLPARRFRRDVADDPAGTGSAPAGERRGPRPHHVHVEHDRPAQGRHAQRRHPCRAEHRVHGTLLARPGCADLPRLPPRAQHRRHPRPAVVAPHRRAARAPGRLGPRARARNDRGVRLRVHRRGDAVPEGPGRRELVRARRRSSRRCARSCAAARRCRRH